MLNLNTKETAHIISMPIDPTYKVISVRKSGLAKELFIMTGISELECKKLKGLNDLENGLAGEEPVFYPHPIAYNCLPHIDVFLENGYTKEEMKMVNETRKILHVDNLPISATCIRVPVEACHGVMIQVELEKEFTLDEVKDALKNYPGIILYDDGKNHIYPNSIVAANQDNVYVGRIRRDLSCENGLLLYCVADNIRKGAAANAVQIAMALDIDRCKK